MLSQRILPALLFFACISCARAQEETEFHEYSNRLIYSDSTMKQLHFIVDSMNIRYRHCDLWKNYYAIPQTIGNYISLDTGDVKAAMADMQQNISYEDFLKKYPLAAREERLPLAKIKYDTRDYDSGKKKRIVEFFSLPFSDYGSPSVNNDDTSIYDRNVAGTWVFEYTAESGKYHDHIRAFFVNEDFSSKKLPVLYEKMIQYADCMVDTNAHIYTANSDDYYYDRKKHKTIPELRAFIRYINNKTGYPDEKKLKDSFWEAYHQWDSVRFVIIDQQLKNNIEFRSKLEKAVKATLAAGESAAELEAYAERYYSPASALALKRNRIVMGRCSMDQSPRDHALNIARLAAESINWEIFLRAHLDIMNDHFARASDGSYAWNARKTYIRELEELELDIPSLMLGIAFRIDNPSGNHYLGSIGRLGRALAESQQWQELEKQMTAAITDKELDDYNRLLIFYLYRNYTYYLDDSSRKEAALQKLEQTKATLPDYIIALLKKEEK